MALLEAMLLESKGWGLGKWVGTEGAAGEEVEEGVGAGNSVWWDGEETTPPTLSFSRTLGSRGGDPSIAQR